MAKACVRAVASLCWLRLREGVRGTWESISPSGRRDQTPRVVRRAEDGWAARAEYIDAFDDDDTQYAVGDIDRGERVYIRVDSAGSSSAPAAETFGTVVEAAGSRPNDPREWLTLRIGEHHRHWTISDPTARGTHVVPIAAVESRLSVRDESDPWVWTELVSAVTSDVAASRAAVEGALDRLHRVGEVYVVGNGEREETEVKTVE